MKKKAVTAGIVLGTIAIISIYFATPSPIARAPEEVQIHWVSVLDSNYEEQDITAYIDCEKLAQTICNYNRGKLPYQFAPYQMAVGDIDIGYFEHGELKHILLGNVNVVYESADKGGFKIYNDSKLLRTIQSMIDSGKVENLET